MSSSLQQCALPGVRASWLVLVWMFFAGCGEPVVLPEAGDVCQSISDCGPTKGLACSLGTCQKIECTRTVQCPTGAACVRSLCGLPDCLEDMDCDTGAGCFEGECRFDLCKDKSDCDDDEVCLGTPPSCQAPPSICVEDADCPSDLKCRVSQGVCQKPCASDTSCGQGRYCDGSFCRNLCSEDKMCERGELCIGGRCALPPDCSMESPCPTTAPYRNPATCACLGCRTDLDCDTLRDEACIDEVCTYCPLRASDDATCQAQGLRFQGACCVRCVDDVDCDVRNGERCREGRCIDERNQRCESDEDCQDGKFCDGFRCIDDASALKTCMKQEDCPQGSACYADGRCRTESTSCSPGCEAPSRCVAEPQVESGTCVGCKASCDTQGCAEGSACYLPEGAAEGYCVVRAFLGSACP